MIAFIAGLAMMIVAACGAGGPDQLQTGKLFPELRGEFLTGEPAVLPQAASGRVALLLLGFSYDSRHAVEAWAKSFANSSIPIRG